MFRVALRQSGDGSKLSHGLQGSLHVQHWRLCLIGEPSTGCKFICSWRLDHIEKAHTMAVPAASVLASSGSSPSSSSGSSHHEPMTLGGMRISSDVLSGAQRMFGIVSSGQSSFSNNTGASTRSGSGGTKDLFFLECSHAAGKGLSNSSTLLISL